MVWLASAWVDPAARDVSVVLRHSRVLPSVALTVTGRSLKFAMYSVPVRPFSGSPAPLACEANRGSRQVPVHTGELVSSFFWAHVSLYETRVR
jgi:hypothetical protein